MIVAASTGFLFVFTTIFVTFPEKISAKIKKNKNDKLAKSLYKEEKIDAEKVEKIVKKDSALDKLKKYFSDKYNDISFVKEAEKKKMEGLTPLKLDMNGPDGVKSAVKLTYRYLAQDENGRLVKGYFPAFSKLDVYSYLSDANMPEDNDGSLKLLKYSFAISFFLKSILSIPNIFPISASKSKS